MIDRVDTTSTAGAGTVHLELDGASLRYSDILDVLDASSLHVTLGESARQGMDKSRAGAQKALKSRSTKGVYGWNRGLGPLKDKELDTAQQVEFQRLMLLSHAAGIGPAFPVPVARLWMVLKANQLAKGTAGVRPALVDRILHLVNAGVTPQMPQIGSLGIGDLQPQAAAGLVITGYQADAPAVLDGEAGLTRDILDAVRLDRVFPLEQGEALPIVSGSTVVAAFLASAMQRATQAADLAEGGVALFMEATRAMTNALDPRARAERNIPAEDAVAARMRALVEGSEWMTDRGRRALKEKKDRVQDAVSVRAAPHIIAALRASLSGYEEDLVREANASTTNPLILKREGRAAAYDFVTSGNWHGGLLGHAADTLNAEITDIAVLQQELSARLLAPAWSYNLPANLAGGTPGLNSGMIQVQTVAAALIPEMQIRAIPSGTLSRPAKFGQEDHNSMAMAALRNLHANLDHMRYVQAVGTLMAAQAVSLIREKMNDAEGTPLALGAGTSRIYDAIICEPAEKSNRVPRQGADRYMTADLEKMVALIDDGSVLRAINDAEGTPLALGAGTSLIHEAAISGPGETSKLVPSQGADRSVTADLEKIIALPVDGTVLETINDADD